MRGYPEDILDCHERTRLRRNESPWKLSGKPELATIRSEQGVMEARGTSTGIQIWMILHWCGSGIRIQNDSP